MSGPIREEPSIWWQSELDNLTVGVDPLPLVGPVRVLRLLDVAALSTMPIVRPAKPALSLITLRLESFARVHSMHPTLRELYQ